MTTLWHTLVIGTVVDAFSQAASWRHFKRLRQSY